MVIGNLVCHHVLRKYSKRANLAMRRLRCEVASSFACEVANLRSRGEWQSNICRLSAVPPHFWDCAKLGLGRDFKNYIDIF